jgi:hypothetical protein
MPGYEVWEHHGEVLPNPNVEDDENNDWAGGGYEVWEHHGEVLPNPNVEDDENNDWAGGDAMHEMQDSLRLELNLSSEDPPTREVSRFSSY